MKNYELIEELMKQPAGYDISFYKASENETKITCEYIEDVEVDETNETITLLCE